MRPSNKIPLPPAAELVEMLDRGITRAELAAEYGCTKTTISVRVTDSGIKEKRERDARRAEIRAAAAAAAAFQSPEWMDRAECREAPDPDAFFPEEGPVSTEALEMCLRCPVRSECLEYAHDHLEQYGLWGGIGARRRQRIRGQRMRSRTA